MSSLMNVSKGVSSVAPAAKDGSFCPSYKAALDVKKRSLRRAGDRHHAGERNRLARNAVKRLEL
jgi:hypothetical protein